MSVLEKTISQIKTTSIDKTNFVVVVDINKEKNIWFIENKFLDIITLLEGSNKCEYQLKVTIKGNEDEGKKIQEGKAVKIVKDTSNIKISVYFQTYGESWKLDHSYQLDLTVFNAYVLVMKNNAEVAKAEKEARKPKNFSLNLPS